MTLRLRLAACVSAMACVAIPLAHAQQVGTRDAPARPSPAQGSSGLSGIVVLDGSNPTSAIRRAIVTLTGTGISTSRQILTDDNGRFVFAGLPTGRFTLTAEKPAYVKAYYGSTRPGRAPAAPITVGEAQQVRDITIPLIKGASISGRMLEESGAPVVAGQVTVELVTFVNGQRTFTRPFAGVYQVVTDDRGLYRAYGLPPGEYIARAIGGGALSGTLRLVSTADIDAAAREVAANARPQPAPTPAPVPLLQRVMSYHPGVSASAAAQTVTVSAGEDRSGVDIVSRVVRVSRASGIALSPTGQPVQNMSVGIANLSTGSLYSSMGIVRSDSNGRFSAGTLTRAVDAVRSRGRTQYPVGWPVSLVGND